jgi:hypothetical protein
MVSGISPARPISTYPGLVCDRIGELRWYMAEAELSQRVTQVLANASEPMFAREIAAELNRNNDSFVQHDSHAVARRRLGLARSPLGDPRS